MLSRFGAGFVGLTAALCLLGGPQAARAADDGLHTEIIRLEHEWAHIKYQVKDADAQTTQISALAEDAAKLAARYPGSAEPLVWEGVITSSEAGIVGGLSALRYVRQARELLEKAGGIDPRALNGAVPTSLGALYYMVPGFPLSFGDNGKARRYLEEGIAISPDGMDSNFFYGDFLYQQGEYLKAKNVLTHALEAPPNTARPVWDAGRREEVKALLGKVQKELVASK